MRIERHDLIMEVERPSSNILLLIRDCIGGI